MAAGPGGFESLAGGAIQTQSGIDYSPLLDDRMPSNTSFSSSAGGESNSHFETELDHKGKQVWALGWGTLAMLLSVWGLQRQISCVTHLESEAQLPARCHGLAGDPDALRLPDFCWEPCNSNHASHFFVMLAVGLVFQLSVIILNHGRCGNWLQLSWFVDPSDVVGADRKGRSRRSWRRPLEYFKQQGWDRVAQEVRKHFTHRGRGGLASVQAASICSRLCLFCASVKLFIMIPQGTSLMGVHFECMGAGEEPLHVYRRSHTRWVGLISLVASFFLLLWTQWLEKKAQCVTKLTVEASSPEILKRHFHIGEPCDYLKGGRRWFANSGSPSLGFEGLSKVRVMALDSIRYRGVRYRPDQALGLVPHRNEKTVDLFFKTAKVRRFFDNFHRKWGVFFYSGASIFLMSASTCCWTCLYKVRAVDGMSTLELDKLLLLMGSCGRAAGIGWPCQVASLLLFVATAQQLAIFAFAESNQAGGDVLRFSKERKLRESLQIRLLDFRKNQDLDAKLFEESKSEMPKFQCHVWVKRPPPEDGVDREEVMDCQTAIEASAQARGLTRQDQTNLVELEKGKAKKAKKDAGRGSRKPGSDDRGEWTRSLKPKEVQLIASDRPSQKGAWMHGLEREDYGLPSICIRIPGDAGHGDEKCQIVPPEFVVGAFHTWVNIGPRHAWEKTSILMGAWGAALALMDVLWYYLTPDGDILDDCSQVMNSHRCLNLKRMGDDGTGPLRFRASLGPYFAVIGALLAVIGMFCVKVAGLVREEEEEIPCIWTGCCSWSWPKMCCACCGAYLEAGCSFAKTACKGARFMLDTLAESFSTMTWGALARSLPQDQDQQEELNEPSPSYSRVPDSDAES